MKEEKLLMFNVSNINRNQKVGTQNFIIETTGYKYFNKSHNSLKKSSTKSLQSGKLIHYFDLSQETGRQLFQRSAIFLIVSIQ